MSNSNQADHKFMLRVPSQLASRVKEWAAKNGRSMNSEITFALEKAYPQPPEPESLNKSLALASKEVLESWEGALKALGQDPKGNHQLMRLKKAIDTALKDY